MWGNWGCKLPCLASPQLAIAHRKHARCREPCARYGARALGRTGSRPPVPTSHHYSKRPPPTSTFVVRYRIMAYMIASPQHVSGGSGGYISYPSPGKAVLPSQFTPSVTIREAKVITELPSTKLAPPNGL